VEEPFSTEHTPRRHPGF